MTASPVLLSRLSTATGRVESRVLIGVCGCLCVMVALNVVLAAFGSPIYWVDELVTNLMGVIGFVGASLLMHKGSHPGVTLISDFLKGPAATAFAVCVAAANLLFAVIVIWLSWRLFDPLGLAGHSFDAMEFALDSGNFTYQEPTLTLGVPKFLFWLVFPIVGVTMTIHTLDAMARLLSGRAAATGS